MKTMQSYLKNIDDIETSSHLQCVDDNEVLKFTRCNSLEEKCLQLLSVEYGEINYERKSDWMRFVNKLNDYDATPLERMLIGDKKKSDWGHFTLERSTRTYSNDAILIKFKEPQALVVETIGNQVLIVEVTELEGCLTWEWLYRKSHADALGNYAGICDVYLMDVKIIK